MSWRKVTLGDLVENFSIRAKDVGGGENLPFYGVSNEDGITKSKYAAEEKADEYKIIEKFCFAYNPYRVNVGSIALMKDEIRGLISPAYVVFKTKPKSIIPDLLLKFLKSSEGLRQIKQYARGTVRQALRFEDLCKIELTIPDYDEQEIFYKRISEVEREVGNVYQYSSHQLSLVKQLRQAFLREAMQGTLIPQNTNDEPASELLKKIKAEKEQLIKEKKIKREKELPAIKPEEIPFEIPKSWMWCRFGYLGDCRLGKMLDANKNTGNLAKYLRNTNVQWHDIEMDDIKQIKLSKTEFEELKLINGDLLICEGGVPGRCAIFKGADEYFTFQKALHRFRSNGSVLTRLIELYFAFSFNEKILQQYYTGNQIKHLTGQSLEIVLIPLPPLSEQHRIVAKLEQLMGYCDELEQSIKESQTQNEQLLQQVLREALQPKTTYEMKDELSLAAEK